MGRGNSRATVRTSTQTEAVGIARDVATNQQSDVVIHRQNSQIREKNSYGNDTYPPKG